MSSENSNDAKKLVTLLSKDGIAIPISLKAVKKCTVIRRLFEDANPAEDENEVSIPVSVVDGAQLKKVVSFLEHHVDDYVDSSDRQTNPRTDPMEPFDRSLIDGDEEEVFRLMYAANFLDCRDLMDLCSRSIAQRIKGKTPEEIRQFLKIRNDFSKEEEEFIRRENDWCL